MSVRIWVVLLFLLTTGLAVTPSVQAACSVSDSAVLTIATGPAFLWVASADGTTAYLVDTIVPSQTYWLWAEGGTTTLGSTQWPDFNIRWYDSSDLFISADTFPGDNKAVVPTAASYGIVYMSYGPDFFTDTPLHGAKFFYEQQCSPVPW